MQAIDVRLGPRSYQIHIGVPHKEQLASAIREMSPAPSKAIVVFDHRTESIAERIASQIGLDKSRVSMIDIPSGEESKSILHLEHLWKRLSKAEADRKSVIVAVGGGVIGDLAGFAAATWNRGIRFIQVPTTLLAMVDSSVGGKTGINLPEAKNVIGAFWQPCMVWSDVTTLASLPTREFRSGLAEVVKYGIILDPGFFDYLESHATSILTRDENALIEIIRRSCLLKAQVVQEDELETTGLRAVLNYGHTFGHAIEALTDYGTFLHGEAIAIGMTMAGHLAVSMKRWPKDAWERQSRLLEIFGLPTRMSESIGKEIQVDSMIEAMMRDKKNAYGRLNLILPTRIGQVEGVSDAPLDLVRQSIAEHLGSQSA
ncbi:MAG: 3-dehydroquinate synthase [Pirellula sp.]|nr:3-dehydroquinate synthase [Pirellula sp.]